MVKNDLLNLTNAAVTQSVVPTSDLTNCATAGTVESPQMGINTFLYDVSKLP